MGECEPGMIERNMVDGYDVDINQPVDIPPCIVAMTPATHHSFGLLGDTQQLQRLSIPLQRHSDIEKRMWRCKAPRLALNDVRQATTLTTKPFNKSDRLFQIGQAIAYIGA